MNARPEVSLKDFLDATRAAILNLPINPLDQKLLAIDTQQIQDETERNKIVLAQQNELLKNVGDNQDLDKIFKVLDAIESNNPSLAVAATEARLAPIIQYLAKRWEDLQTGQAFDLHYTISSDSRISRACMIVAKNIGDILGVHAYKILIPTVKVHDYIYPDHTKLIDFKLHQFLFHDNGNPVTVKYFFLEYYKYVQACVSAPPGRMSSFQEKKNLKIAWQLFAEHSALAKEFYMKLEAWLKAPKNQSEYPIILTTSSEPQFNLNKLQEISKRNNDRPILINIAGQISMYGFSEGKWKVTPLDNKPFMHLPFPAVDMTSILNINLQTETMRQEIKLKKGHFPRTIEDEVHEIKDRFIAAIESDDYKVTASYGVQGVEALLRYLIKGADNVREFTARLADVHYLPMRHFDIFLSAMSFEDLCKIVLGVSCTKPVQMGPLSDAQREKYKNDLQVAAADAIRKLTDDVKIELTISNVCAYGMSLLEIYRRIRLGEDMPQYGSYSGNWMASIGVQVPKKDSKKLGFKLLWAFLVDVGTESTTPTTAQIQPQKSFQIDELEQYFESKKQSELVKLVLSEYRTTSSYAASLFYAPFSYTASTIKSKELLQCIGDLIVRLGKKCKLKKLSILEKQASSPLSLTRP